MALLSFVDSTPRAYRLKAGNACSPLFNISRDIPKADGKQYPATQANQTKQRTVSFTIVDPYTTTFQFYNDGKPGQSGTRTTSKDGKTMTLDTKNTNAQGQTYTSHSEFDKQ
jgi:hypothetical protein